MQECGNSIANALELPQSCTKPSIRCICLHDHLLMYMAGKLTNKSLDSGTVATVWTIEGCKIHLKVLYNDCKMENFFVYVFEVMRVCTVYSKKYAHGFCFAVLCCGYTLTDFPISINLTSLALDKYFT